MLLGFDIGGTKCAVIIGKLDGNKEIIIPSKPGNKAETVSGVTVEMNPYKSADSKQSIDIFAGGGLTIAAHIHQSDLASDGTRYYGIPGPGDPGAFKAAVDEGYTNASSYAMVVGAGDNKASFYTEKGPTTSVSFTKLLSLYGIQ